MEVLVREDGECLVFDEVPSVDAYDAREAQHNADMLKARTVAQQLRRRAEKLVAHARRLEELAAEGAPWESDQNVMDPGELLECLLDPSPEVIMAQDALGGRHYLDLVTLAYCNADVEDPEIVQEYIGSSADITDRVQEELALVDEAYDNYVQWLKERK
jgi:hypothetical protein